MKRCLISAVLFGVIVLALTVQAMPPELPKSKDKTPSTKPAESKLDEVKTGFIEETDYTLFVPLSYKGKKDAKSYPLILFLHGYGQNAKPKGPPENVPGLGPHIRSSKEVEQAFPFFVIFPRGKSNGFWFDNDSKASKDMDRALEILKEVEQHYGIDAKRLYLVGVSMGGRAVWLQAEKDDRWAAIAPLSAGNGDPPPPKDSHDKAQEKTYQDKLTAVKALNEVFIAHASDIKMPCWCFHEKQDLVVPVDYSEAMAAKLKAKTLKPGEAASGRRKAFFTLFDDCGESKTASAHAHCWQDAFSDPKASHNSDEKENLYDWLLKQHLK